MAKRERPMHLLCQPLIVMFRRDGDVPRNLFGRKIRECTTFRGGFFVSPSAYRLGEERNVVPPTFRAKGYMKVQILKEKRNIVPPNL